MSEDLITKPVKLCNCGAQMPSTPCDPACPDDLGTYTLPAEDCAALIAVGEMAEAEAVADGWENGEWVGGSEAIDLPPIDAEPWKGERVAIEQPPVDAEPLNRAGGPGEYDLDGPVLFPPGTETKWYVDGREVSIEEYMRHADPNDTWRQQPVEPEDKAVKHDSDKAPLGWVAPEYIQGTAEVLAFGGNKYAPGNWSKGGFSQTQLAGAVLRHVYAHLAGEDFDPESGLRHIYHASCGLMFLAAHIERGSIVEDRVEKGVAVDD